MYEILSAKTLAENIYCFEVEAKRVSARCMPGQFVIVRAMEDSERISRTSKRWKKRWNFYIFKLY